MWFCWVKCLTANWEQLADVMARSWIEPVNNVNCVAPELLSQRVYTVVTQLFKTLLIYIFFFTMIIDACWELLQLNLADFFSSGDLWLRWTLMGHCDHPRQSVVFDDVSFCCVQTKSDWSNKNDSPKMDIYDKLEDSSIISGQLFRLAIEQGSNFQITN